MSFDLTIRVAGRGGDGSLTLVDLLGRMLHRRGLYVYTTREVGSRIRGGPAAAVLRVASRPVYRVRDRAELVVAFDEPALQGCLAAAAPGAVVVFDESSGRPAALDALTGASLVVSAPLGRIAVRDLRRDVFRNVVALGVVCRLLGLGDEVVRTAITDRFARRGDEDIQANLAAYELGLAVAADAGFPQGEAPALALPPPQDSGTLLMTGNDAVAFGFLAAGGRFFAGYPITPATEIMLRLQRWLPGVDGVVQQCEDELAAVNMALGAALTGTRAMTATSGPGLSLMLEGIGQAGMAEIPLVVVDCQRGGASTGMPTKPEQSDLAAMALGGHGDFPRVVLSPSHPEDCFHLTVAACNLAERLQCPVLIAMDQAIAQDVATVERFDPARVVVDRGERLSGADLVAAGGYRRYAITPTGVSPFAPPGLPGSVALVTGNEHDEFGHVSVDPANRVRQVEKRARKVDLARSSLPAAHRGGDPTANIGIIGIGMSYGAIVEAVQRLLSIGVPARWLMPRTIAPVLDETLDFAKESRLLVVVEHNASAQLAGLLRHAGAITGNLVELTRFDGRPITPEQIVAKVLETEPAP